MIDIPKIITYEEVAGFIPDIREDRGISIANVESAINLAFSTLDGFCGGKISLAWKAFENQETNNPLFLTEDKLYALKTAMLLQVQYSLTIANDFSEGQQTASQGGSSVSISSANRERIPKRVQDQLIIAGVYSALKGTEVSLSPRVVGSGSSYSNDPLDNYVTYRVGDNRYLMNYQPQIPVNYVPMTNDNRYITWYSAEELVKQALGDEYLTVEQAMVYFYTKDYIEANYYSKTQIDEKLDAIDIKIGEVSGDLSNYYTKSEVDSKVSTLQSKIDTNTANINTLTTKTTELNSALVDTNNQIVTLETDIKDLGNTVNDNTNSINKQLTQNPLFSAPKIRWNKFYNYLEIYIDPNIFSKNSSDPNYYGNYKPVILVHNKLKMNTQRYKAWSVMFKPISTAARNTSPYENLVAKGFDGSKLSLNDLQSSYDSSKIGTWTSLLNWTDFKASLFKWNTKLNHFRDGYVKMRFGRKIKRTLKQNDNYLQLTYDLAIAWVKNPPINFQTIVKIPRENIGNMTKFKVKAYFNKATGEINFGDYFVKIY